MCHGIKKIKLKLKKKYFFLKKPGLIKKYLKRDVFSLWWDAASAI